MHCYTNAVDQEVKMAHQSLSTERSKQTVQICCRLQLVMRNINNTRSLLWW